MGSNEVRQASSRFGEVDVDHHSYDGFSQWLDHGLSILRGFLVEPELWVTLRPALALRVPWMAHRETMELVIA